MRIVTIGSLLAASVLVSGCATVTRGTRETFKIQSTPTEAKVALSNGESCVTPCTLKVKRRPGFTATFTKDGFETKTVTVDSEIHGGGVAAGAGNILAGGIIGGIVDGTNGSLNSLSPNPLQVTLQPVATASAPAAPTVAPDATTTPDATATAPGSAGQPGGE
jgi:hypothetical protein